MRNRSLAPVLLLIGSLSVAMPAAWAGHPFGWSKWPDLNQRVVRLEITRPDRTMELASAIHLGNGELVTNCHAVRGAGRIRATLGGASWPAYLDNGDAYRDLCMLAAPGLQGTPLALAGEPELQVGMPVYAVGYTDGELAVRQGTIKGLHTCPCASGRVIQTSAAFDRGASGGGLFDRHGRLLGILTFKARAGGDFHFAVPVDWLHAPLGSPLPPTGSGRTFWEQSGEERIFFLAACALGARQDWPPLNALAEQWTTEEPGNPEAWMALGRARLGLGEAEPAVTAFQQVLRLDASHDGAAWELQKLEFDLDRNLLAH